MAIHNSTRQQIRHDVADLCDDLIIGTVSSPASGTFVCALADWEKPDDYFNKFLEMFCYSGTGVGTSGKPTDWLNSSHTLTFKPAATLTAGDLVEMHNRFTVNQYNRAINQSIQMVAKEALQDKTDVSIALVTDTYQYSLPTDLTHIYSIDLESDTADLYDSGLPIKNDNWRIIPGSTIKLEFIKQRYSITNGRNIRIKGLASPSTLDTDGEQCPINPVFIAYQAAALLHQSRIRAGEVDTEYHAQQMQLCQTLANEVRRTIQTSTAGAVPVIEY